MSIFPRCIRCSWNISLIYSDERNTIDQPNSLHSSFMTSDSDDDAHQRSAMHRTFQILRTMAEQQHQGVRVTYLAKTLGMTPATTHRLLQGLTQEGMVEQDQQNKLYRLSLDLFCLAAQAGAVNDLRTVARP